MRLNIVDPIYGNLKLNELEKDLADSGALQRLRRIKQLAFVYLVYPGANHTRFEHSLGTMFIAGRLATRLNLDRQVFRVAGLLHDIGHGPHSHLLENHKRHEEETIERIQEGEIRRILEEHNVPIDRIINIIKRNSKYSGVVSGNIDADRVDYLRRDAYYTGNPAGVISQDRIIETAVKVGDKIGLKEKGKLAAENLLYGRHLMMETVYRHHTVIAARKMAKEAVESAFEKGKLTLEEAYKMNDEELNSFFIGIEGPEKELWQQLLDRRLYKTAYSIKTGKLDSKIREEELRDKIAGDLGLEKRKVFVDVPELKTDEINIPILTKKGDTVRLSKISPIVRSIEKAERELNELRVFTTKEHREKVRGRAKEILA